MLFYCLLAFGICLPSIVGKTEWGFKAYTKYEPGNMNLIITAPHNGHLSPSRQANGAYWPNRRNGSKGRDGECIWSHTGGAPSAECHVHNLDDLHTVRLARYIVDRIKAITGFRPHAVYNRLKRCKLDCNREIIKATFSVPDAIKAYHDYSNFIGKAKSAIRGRGLLLDIHGQEQYLQKTELGYLIQNTEFAKDAFSVGKSSIRSLGHYWCGSNSTCLKDFINGNRSLGHFMNQEGLLAVPSPQEPAPNDTDYTYFAGGYTVKHYGSRYGGDIDAIQMEFPTLLRSNAGWKKAKNRLVRAILGFFKVNYDNLQTAQI